MTNIEFLILDKEIMFHPLWLETYAITYRNMGVSGVALGIGGRENSVNKNKSANNLGAETVAFGVSGVDNVGAAALGVVQGFSEPLHHSGTANRPKTLHHNVVHQSRKRHFPRQKQPKRHRRINMTTYKQHSSDKQNKSKN